MERLHTQEQIMPHFTSEGYDIAYESYGEGPLILAIHGFASNGQVNWLNTGWVETLTDAGYRVATIDNRGHGASEKIYDTAAYPSDEMAKDAINLIDHLGTGPAALLGYSMGARISAFACLRSQGQVACAIFGGLGSTMITGLPGSSEIAEAMRAATLDDVEHPRGRQFRLFAEHTGSDLEALANCMESSRQRITEEDVAKIDVPVLVAVGELDEEGGDPMVLASHIPQGQGYVIPKRDHMRATGDKRFKEAALEFLGNHYPAQNRA